MSTLHGKGISRAPSFFRCRGAVSGSVGRFHCWSLWSTRRFHWLLGWRPCFVLDRCCRVTSLPLDGYLRRIYLQSLTGSLRESQCVHSPQVEGGDSGTPRQPSGRWVVNRRVCFAFWWPDGPSVTWPPDPAASPRSTLWIWALFSMFIGLLPTQLRLRLLLSSLSRFTAGRASGAETPSAFSLVPLWPKSHRGCCVFLHASR